MATPFDSYRTWLRTLARYQQPTHYQLLLLEPYEKDAAVIKAAADRLGAIAKRNQSGESEAEATRLLQDLATARACLLDPAAKRAYDTALKCQNRASSPKSYFDGSAKAPATQPGVRRTRPMRASEFLNRWQGWLVGCALASAIYLVAYAIVPRLHRHEPVQSLASETERDNSLAEFSQTPQAILSEDIPTLEAPPSEPADTSELPVRGPTEAASQPLPTVDAGVTVSPPRPTPIDPAPRRYAVPSQQRQQELHKLLDQFEPGMLQGTDSKQQAIRKLVQMSGDATLAADERYGVLKALIALAIAVGDADQCLEAADALVEAYEVDCHLEKAQILTEFLNASKPSTQAKAAVDGAIAVAHSLSGDDRYSDATLLLNAAQAAARRSAIAEDLKKSILAARTAITAREKEWKAFVAAVEALDADADNAAANFTAGAWHGVYRRDWKKALPLLAKGNDPIWSAAATLELATPTAADDQVAIANAWYEIAATASPTVKMALFVHAGTWYERAAPQLTSVLIRQTVSERLAVIAPFKSALSLPEDATATNDVAAPGEWVDLLAWAEGVDWTPRGIDWNAHLDGRPTKRGITLKPQWCNRFPLPAIIDGNYELEIEFTRLDGEDGVSIFFPVLSHNMHLELGKNRGGVDFVGWFDGERSEKNPTAKRPSILSASNKKHAMRIESRVEGDAARFSIDLDHTRDYIHWSGKYSSLTNLEAEAWKLTLVRHVWIGAMQSRVRFDKIRIRMLSGSIRRDTVTEADRQRDLNSGFVRLIGMKPSAQSVGWSRFMVNQVPLEFGPGSAERAWPRMRAFSICKDYYGAHAPSHLRCPIPAGAKSFSVVGYNDSESEAKYIVCFDGKVTYMSAATHMAVIKTDVPANATFLDLLIDPAGDNAGDHTYWCYPRFHTVAANAITDEMIDAESGPLKFTVSSSSVGFAALTHNQPINTLYSAPLNFRDALPCDEFLFAHGASSLIYEVPKGMTRFSAVGFNTISQHTKFEVWADAKRIFASPQAGIIPIDVKLPPGTKNIALKVNSLGDQHHDLSFWCYPRLSSQ